MSETIDTIEWFSELPKKMSDKATIMGNDYYIVPADFLDAEYFKSMLTVEQLAPTQSKQRKDR